MGQGLVVETTEFVNRRVRIGRRLKICEEPLGAIAATQCGNTSLQLFADADLGGNVPAFAQNMIMPQIVKVLFTSLRTKSTWV